MQASPLDALVALYQQLPHARTPALEREFVQASAALRRQLRNHTEEQTGFSPLATRMLKALGEQEVTGRTWALAVRLSPTDGSFKRAKRELVTAGKVKQVKKGLYRASDGARLAPGTDSAKDFSLQTA